MKGRRRGSFFFSSDAQPEMFVATGGFCVHWSTAADILIWSQGDHQIEALIHIRRFVTTARRLLRCS